MTSVEHVDRPPPLARRIERPRTLIMMSPYYTSDVRRCRGRSCSSRSLCWHRGRRRGPPSGSSSRSATASPPGSACRRAEAYPALLERAAPRRRAIAYRVVNAGVSGDTTAGGLRRVDWALRSRPEIVIVELGANDALRGQDLASVRANLDQRSSTRFQAAGARVLLAGMRLPPNYGAPVRRPSSSGCTQTVARARRAAFMPFFLDGVAGDPAPEPGRRHPSDRGRLPRHRRPPLAGPEAAPLEVAGAAPARQTEREAARARGPAVD